MNIHFIGIGGVSMSGLASICLERGDHVSGSDNHTSEATQKLQAQGATIYLGHKKENITPEIDLVVYTAAIHHNNPELVMANQLGIRIMNRAVFLGQLMQNYPNTIAISGTHGKTSTTSMVSTIFVHAGTNPTITVGGNLKEIGGNYRIGTGDYFITEACEYVDSFFSLYPKYAIVLNMEHEHIDYFKDIDQVIRSFQEFASHVPKDGKILANGDDPNVRKALSHFPQVVFFGFNENNDCVIKNYHSLSFGSEFTLSFADHFEEHFQIHVIGDFNILNATAAILCSYCSGLDLKIIQSGIAAYHGVGRRFEAKGEFRGAKVFDDYAHHPSEVKATLSAAKKLPKNRLITIFQPHTFSRTLLLMDEFEKSFDDTDLLLLMDIYPSRELDDGKVHSKDLLKRLEGRNFEVHYQKTDADALDFLQQYVQPGDIILTMGAGDVNKIADALLQIE